MNRKQEHLLKISAIFWCLSATLSALQQPATSYEPSIYTAAPLPLWICLTAGFVFSVSSILVSRGDYYAIVAGSVVTAGHYFLLFTIPLARNYILSARGTRDVLLHIGLTRNIDQILENENWYPLLHSLYRVIRELGLEWELTIATTATIFILVYAFGIGILARQKLGSRRYWWFALAVGFIPVFGSFVRSSHPAMYSFMLVPLLWSIYIVTPRRWERNFIMITLGVGIVFFHPITAGLLVLILMVEEIGNAVYIPSWRFNPIIPALVVAGTGWWYTGFTRLGYPLSSVLLFDIGGAGETQTSAVTTGLLTPLQIFIRFIELYGASVIVLSVGTLGIMMLLHENITLRFRKGVRGLSFHLVVATIFAMVFIVVNLIVAAPLRTMRYLLLIAALGVPITVDQLNIVDNQRSRGVLRVACIGILIFGLIIGMGTVYDPNSHMTRTELSGSQFQAEYQPQDLPTYSFGTDHKMDLYLGIENGVFAGPPFPISFGYDNGNTIGGRYGPGFLVTKTYDEMYYTIRYESQHDSLQIYTESDKDQLSIDTTSHTVYSNGGYTVWELRTQEET